MSKTFAMIKPDAVKNKYAGKIIDRIIQEGFTITGLKQKHMSLTEAEGFYEVHKERPFFGELTEFMSSGPVYLIAMEREDAFSHWRKVIGATDPAEADAGTIRKMYATSKGENAVHGSDSDDNAEIEIAYWFSQIELS